MRAEAPVLLSLRGVSKAYGARTLFDGVTLHVRAGEKVALLGANGTGKSTLLAIAAGAETADSGVLDRKIGARIEYLSQDPELPGEATAYAVVAEGLTEWSRATERHAVVTALLHAGDANEGLLDEQAKLSDRIEHLGGWGREHVVRDVLGKLGIVDVEQPVGTMSGGERRRVALARLLVAAPDLAILDEPTNHLDADVVEWLEETLAESFHGAVLLVTHDRYVLDAVATRIVELDHGSLYTYEGDFADYVEGKAERLALEARTEQNRQNLLRRETAWLRRGAKARSTKQKARIQRAEALLAERGPSRTKELELAGLGAGGARTGGTILDFLDASYRLPAPPSATDTAGGRLLLQNFTLRMVKGERLGVVGKNGSGKTTLLRLVTGELEASSGRVVLGKNTRISHFDQARSGLEEGWSIFDNVAGREGAEIAGGGMVTLGAKTMDLRTYLETFLFDPAKQRQKVASLSGGERARVALAKVLREGGNLLLLDEPTNDLDLFILGALEELLESWPGCLLVVSHDRAFLDRVATSTLVFEGDGRVVQYPGGFSTARALREAATGRAAAAAETAHAASTPRITSNPAAGAASNEGARPKPLTYAERLELETLIDKITDAERRAGGLLAELSLPGSYRDAEAAKRTKSAHEAAAREVAALTARWEALEARREATR